MTRFHGLRPSCSSSSSSEPCISEPFLAACEGPSEEFRGAFFVAAFLGASTAPDSDEWALLRLEELRRCGVPVTLRVQVREGVPLRFWLDFLDGGVETWPGRSCGVLRRAFHGDFCFGSIFPLGEGCR